MPKETDDLDQNPLSLMADQSALVFAGLLFGGYDMGDAAAVVAADVPARQKPRQQHRVGGLTAEREAVPTLLDAA
jgi:hypothetical protein